jgi:(p)ppGpp synthase/HD superfamily hydrolase
MTFDPGASPLLSPLVEQAVEISAQWHDHTYRKGRWRDPAFTPPDDRLLGVPVIAHLTNVAIIVMRAGWDDVTVAAALLHDVIEDANQFGEELRFGELTALMGVEVAQRVREVTERQYDSNGNPRRWKDRKVDYVATLRTASPGGVAISLADKLHNLWSMNESLARGINIFVSEPGRKRLSAGPDEQTWFFRAVLDASMQAEDTRLAALRKALSDQIDRFDGLVSEL